MGGGASKKNAKKQQAKKAVDDLVGLSDAMKRRRRVLLGNAHLAPFEQVPCRNQFTAFPEIIRRPENAEEPRPENPEIDEEDDIVFDRLGIPLANQFRESASVRSNSDFLLGPDTIEMLGLGVRPGSTLSNRIFKIGQIAKTIVTDPEQAAQPSKKEPSKKAPVVRPNFLTCYELMALYSVIQAGTREELLELIFCIFDQNGDDRVSVEDFEETISSYLEMEGQTGLEGDDLDTYKNVNSTDKTMAARRVAELAVAKYGDMKMELPPPDADLSEGEDIRAEPGRKGKERGKEKGKVDKEKSKVYKNKEKGKDEGKDKGDEEVTDDADEKKGPVAKKENSKGNKKKGSCCLCKGKKPLEESEEDPAKKNLKKDADEKKKQKNPLLESEGESDVSEYSSERPKEDGQEDGKPKASSKAKAKASPKRKRRSLCGGKKPDDTETEDEKNVGTRQGKGKDKDKKEAESSKNDSGTEKATRGRKQNDKKDSKNATRSRSRSKSNGKKGGCCGGKRQNKLNKLPPPLTFEQWKTWFDEHFADFILPDEKSAAATMMKESSLNMVSNSQSMVTHHASGIIEQPANIGKMQGERAPSKGSGQGSSAGGGIRQFRVDDDGDSLIDSESQSMR